MMKKLVLFLVFITLITLPWLALAQNANCTQQLRLARSTYEQGRLHDLPTQLEGCLKSENGFTKQEKIDAYKILTLAYIYLEEPDKANETMLSLLQTDHYFEINEAVDPAELVALYKTFRTKSIFNIGAKFGTNLTMPAILSNYYVAADAVSNGKNAPKVGFQFGIVFEKIVLKRFFKGKDKDRLTLSTEAFYTIRKYNYTNSSVFKDDSTQQYNVSDILAPVNQTWIDLNPVLQYKIKNSVLNPYVGLGPGFSFLLSSSFPLTTKLPQNITLSGASVNDKESYRKLAYSLIATAGVKYKFGSVLLTGDVRYQFGLHNVISAKNRSNQILVSDYIFTHNNYRQNNFTVNFGFVFPYFNPIKLIKK